MHACLRIFIGLGILNGIAFGDTITITPVTYSSSVSAQAVVQTCSDPSSCSVTSTIGPFTVNAAASVTGDSINLSSNGPGGLASGSITDDKQVTITGGSGPGTAALNFFFFIGGGDTCCGGIQPTVIVTFGSAFDSVQPGSGPVTLLTPFSYETPFAFNVSINGSASTIETNEAAFAFGSFDFGSVGTIMPEPSALWLAFSGLVGLAFASRLRA